MGNATTKIGNAWDDDGETYVMVDRRGVILDLPEAPGVAQLLRARGYDAAPVASRLPDATAVPSPKPAPSAPAPFWLRWPFRAKPRTRITG